MSMIALGLAAAAAAAVSGWLTARALKRRRGRALPAAASPEDRPKRASPSSAEQGRAPVPAVDPLAHWPFQVGDVVQFGDETRWLRSAILARADDGLRCAVLLGDEGVTALMAPPDRHVYWLRRETMTLPASPPARIEIGGLLLDRRVSVPVRLEAVGEDPPEVDAEGVLNLYTGSAGDAAVVLTGATPLVWYGLRLAPDEVDRLGQGSFV